MRWFARLVRAFFPGPSWGVALGGIATAAAGIAAIVAFSWGRPADATAIAGSLLAAVSGAVFAGFLPGLLFAIPKASRRAEAVRGRVARPEPGTDEAPALQRYIRSTNLERISDWLTTMVVGVGLVEAREIGAWFSAFVEREAALLGSAPSARLLLGGLIVTGVVWGFLIGYLYSSIQLPLVMRDSDEASSRVQTIYDDVAAVRAGGRTALAALPPEIVALADEYDRVHGTTAPSAARTALLEDVAARMRRSADVAREHLAALCVAPGAGTRMVAIAALQVRPDRDRVAWLAERVGTERPFVAYHALVALAMAARDPGCRAAVADALPALRKRRDELAGTDRAAVLERIESELKG